MMIWLVRKSLPWSRIADPWLRACIQYMRPEAKLYGRHWAALEAKRLNFAMKEQAIKELKVSNCSVSLFFYLSFSISQLSIAYLFIIHIGLLLNRAWTQSSVCNMMCGLQKEIDTAL